MLTTIRSGPADEAIRSGTAFDVELLVDTIARTAQASLTVGTETFETPVTTAATFEAMQPDLAAQANSAAHNGAPFSSIASDALRFEIYVPEPGASAAALAAMAALVVRAATKRP